LNFGGETPRSAEAARMDWIVSGNAPIIAPSLASSSLTRKEVEPSALIIDLVRQPSYNEARLPSHEGRPCALSRNLTNLCRAGFTSALPP
jgi:hypothetical protein